MIEELEPQNEVQGRFAAALPDVPSVIVVEVNVGDPEALHRVVDLVDHMQDQLRRYCEHHDLPTPLMFAMADDVRISGPTPVTAEQLEQLIGALT